jgi:hypothetical protein
MEAERLWQKDLASVKRFYPDLEDGFDAFALKPSHRTTPIDILAKLTAQIRLHASRS